MIEDRQFYDGLVAKWVGEERMTPEEIAQLQWGDDGQPLTSHQITREAFLKAHGDKPLTYRQVDAMLLQVAKEVGGQLRPMRRQIAALEAELRAGNDRLKALEGGE